LSDETNPTSPTTFFHLFLSGICGVGFCEMSPQWVT
jgi:hypothetical protein